MDNNAPIGVLLTNLGTPDAPTTSSVRRYLAEFLSDPRVVETPRLLWLPVLYGVILNTRPRKSAEAYQRVWTDQGSPLMTISRSQASLVAESLEQKAPERFRVALAMRYGSPSIRDGLEELRDAGATRVLLLPLYPQYSASTSASTVDALMQVLKSWRVIPEIRVINEYHDSPGYIGALVKSIQDAWDSRGQAEKLLFSFHGLPQEYVEKGDPYRHQCETTTRLVVEALGLSDDQWVQTFQSRVGPKEWLQPYTDKTLEALAQSGVKSIQVVCPGFSADCLETLEEIDMENREIFLANGGKAFSYIPALNDNREHVESISDLIIQHSQGWDCA